MRPDLTPGASNDSKIPATAEEETDSTGLPGLRKWSTLYLLVALTFVAQVVLLTALTKVYS